jgi:hypothetical protein
MAIGLQDALIHFNSNITGSWYGWIDSADGEVYSNLKLINDDATMPTEEQVNAKIAELQANLDYQNLDYVKARKSSYPDITEQFDKLWHDINNGTLDNTGAFYTALKTVKDDNPKPGE